MKIIFMGSDPFALPSLNAIAQANFSILSVVAQPDKPAGRGHKLTSPPTILLAKELGLTTFQPPSLKNPQIIHQFSEMKPDIIVVVAYGKFLPKGLIDLPKSGTVNVHPSLLPKYRGPAPINWAIINGDHMTGVSTMFLSEKMDAGDILLQENVDISDTDTAETLSEKCAKLGAELLIETLCQLRDHHLVAHPQHHDKVTLAPILKKEDGHIDWRLPAKQLRNRIRGLQPWPGSFTYLNGKLLKIFSAIVEPEMPGDKPGTITAIDGDAIIVATGHGHLALTELQLEGKSRMGVADFLKGHPLKPGMTLDQPKG